MTARTDEYAKLLQSQKLWPVDPMTEQNWSGRGQHAKFEKDEQQLIADLLVVQENLGSTRTAIVQSVKCRRILLARKTIICGRRSMTQADAVMEVAHLTRLSHAHIIRVIGTYVKGRELSILLYPVAEYNLDGFLEALQDESLDAGTLEAMLLSKTRFYSCLTNAVKYIHLNLTKHMDIKPQNILIRRTRQNVTKVSLESPYKCYVVDFGIARAYETPEAIETDSRTAFTKRYAAPEVVKQEFRGLPADIFSLGCVFLEIVAASVAALEDMIEELLASNVAGDTSYSVNVARLCDLLIEVEQGRKQWRGDGRIDKDNMLKHIIEMLHPDPGQRPTADRLRASLGQHPCCEAGPEKLKAMPEEQ
ncbi:kinase-like protein [Setomelanomma holmii]|uniref:Kinase-like protein n=1 Tax=Setomelanomma holmii TaxID=210430 RepID=A0A9P4HA99_9PLEO|nr:kinase-like protein [Setomelanomma holmii]